MSSSSTWAAGRFPYIVMEFVEGEPLDSLIKSNRLLPMIYKLKILEQVCAALSYARGQAARFGIARQETIDRDLSLTQTGSIIGTVPYMAPERLKGAPLDGRSDLFAAGVVLFQLLTGRLPFEGEEMALVTQLLNDPYPPWATSFRTTPPNSRSTRTFFPPRKTGTHPTLPRS